MKHENLVKKGDSISPSITFLVPKNLRNREPKDETFYPIMME